MLLVLLMMLLLLTLLLLTLLHSALRARPLWGRTRSDSAPALHPLTPSALSRAAHRCSNPAPHTNTKGHTTPSDTQPRNRDRSDLAPTINAQLARLEALAVELEAATVLALARHQDGAGPLCNAMRLETRRDVFGFTPVAGRGSERHARQSRAVQMASFECDTGASVPGEVHVDVRLHAARCSRPSQKSPTVPLQ